MAIRTDPHATQPVFPGGAPPGQAKAGVILLHGRGGSPHDMLELAGVLDCVACAYLAPQAAEASWYPYRFWAPLEQNEPWLSSALEKVGAVLAQFEQAGLSGERVVLIGFSQGACLALEYAARHPQRYGGVAGLSGALIGPPGIRRESGGNLAGTPVLLGCSDADPHIPRERVDESAQVLLDLGGNVTQRIYPGLGHRVNADEVGWVNALLNQLVGGPQAPPTA